MLTAPSLRTAGKSVAEQRDPREEGRSTGKKGPGALELGHLCGWHKLSGTEVPKGCTS